MSDIDDIIYRPISAPPSDPSLGDYFVCNEYANRFIFKCLTCHILCSGPSREVVVDHFINNSPCHGATCGKKELERVQKARVS